MGFIKAFAGAVSGTLADEWKDFLMPENAPATAGVFRAVQEVKNAGRGTNYKGSYGVITNGSRIIVPEGTALITMQDGAVTGCITEAGGYIYKSSDPNAQSFLAGNSIKSSLKASWERFKFGGIPGSRQNVIYVNLKEIPGNKFGTQSEIYWDDIYLNAQAGAMARGMYTLKITDPILFIKNFVPAEYLNPDSDIFDFADMDNPAAEQLFTEVVSSLAAGFSNYTNDPARGNRITKIQGDQIGFAQSLSQAVEDNYRWKSDRGLEIVKAAIAAIEYDADTKELLKDVKKADALSGQRGSSFMQQSAARGFQAAGEKGGASGMAFMGMGINTVNGTMNSYQQPGYQSQQSYQNGPGYQSQQNCGQNGYQSQQSYQSGNGQNYQSQQSSQNGSGYQTQQAWNQNGQYYQNTGSQQGFAPMQPMEPMQPMKPMEPMQPMQWNNGQNNNAPNSDNTAPVSSQPGIAEDPYEHLKKLKGLLDCGVISQEDFDAAKKKVLGI